MLRTMRRNARHPMPTLSRIRGLRVGQESTGRWSGMDVNVESYSVLKPYEIEASLRRGRTVPSCLRFFEEMSRRSFLTAHSDVRPEQGEGAYGYAKGASHRATPINYGVSVPGDVL